MILDNLFENTVQGYDNLRQLISAHSQKQPATIMVGGEPVTLDYPEVNFMIGQYKAYMRAGKQEKFLRDLEDPVAFDRHMKILRDLIDKQRNFQGSVPGEREVPGEKSRPWESLGETIATLESMMAEANDIGQSVKATGYKNIGLIATSLDRNPTEPITLRFSNGSTYEMDDPREKKWFVAKLRTYTRKNVLDRLIIDMADRGRFEEHLAQLADYMANQEMSKPQQGYEESQQVSEVKKKKQKSGDLDRDEIVDPKLKSELIKARAKYPAAASDLEAFLKAARNQITTGHKDIESVKDETNKQQNLINQIVQIDRNQQKELQALDQENDDQENEIKRLQDLNDKLAQAVASMGQTRQELPTKRTQRQTTKKKDTRPQTRNKISKIVPYDPEPVVTQRKQPPTLVPEPNDVPQGSLDLKTGNGSDILVKTAKQPPLPLKLVASKEPRQTAVNESSKYYAICVEGQAMVKYTDISEAHRNSVRLKQQFPDANITTKIFEAGEFNRAGYNAIKNVSDWEEKMRVMQELLKNNELMQDPEAKAAVQQRIGDLNRVGIQQGYVNEQNMPGTKIPQKSIIQGYTVFYDPKTKIVSITRGGDSAEAAIEQARVNTTSIKAFRQVVERLIDKIETEQGVTEGQLDEKQDACYHKVKSRYKVWPSAYASGALVQCRKKGAANWGNKSKK